MIIINWNWRFSYPSLLKIQTNSRSWLIQNTIPKSIEFESKLWFQKYRNDLFFVLLKFVLRVSLNSYGKLAAHGRKTSLIVSKSRFNEERNVRNEINLNWMNWFMIICGIANLQSCRYFYRSFSATNFKRALFIFYNNFKVFIFC